MQTGVCSPACVKCGELDLDLLASRIREEIVDRPVHRVVIDSLAEMVFAARKSDRFPRLRPQPHRTRPRSRRDLLITSVTTTLGPSPEPSGGVTLLLHNVILLRW